MAKRIDPIGKTYNRWTVIRREKNTFNEQGLPFRYGIDLVQPNY